MKFMTISSIISLIGIAYLAYRVYLYKGKSSGSLRYLKLFIYTLFIYLLFHFLQITFFTLLPLTFIKTFYLLDKTFSLITSAFAIIMAVEYFKPRLTKIIMYILFSLIILIMIYLLFNVPDPNFSLYPFVSWTRTGPIFIINIFMMISFLFVSILFFILAHKYQEQRVRFISFGLAFLLWIIGGPMHSAKNELVVIIADLIVLFGFAMVGYVLFLKKEKSLK